ncbi:hypothetical protein M413DRAFT_24911 [Hebeloma cylindrosporum]|uniref:Uncharacterized protein n=1 Tax=Hebeloma cylindrosporum TaxID=76867 RepID=A0A0C2Y3G9_HEBCY|nr:hypothetical protein M413DRAFT_24911 [Hebeloma cylindrosporum h7]
MVKRDKSPEVVEDSRFFTIFLPYPLNGDWQDESETRKLAWWIAECVGEESLWAILWKPSSAGMVLIEVSKSFTDHGRLLGEHRWVDILKNPTEEEKQGSSRIFHCWKIAAVTKDWFDGWEPGKGKFKQPYPETHWCAVPVEDRTGKPLCRPLPLEAKSPPPQVQPPVVGSSKWVEQQAEAPPKGTSWPKKQHQPRNPSGGWGNNPYAVGTSPVSEASSWGLPAAVSPTASGASSPAPATPMSADSQLPAESAPNKAPNKTVWGKPVPLKTFNNEGNNQNKGPSGWSKPVQPPAPAGGISPLAEPKPTGPVNAWAKPLKVTLAQRVGARVEPAVATNTANPANRGKLNPLAKAAAAAAASVGGLPAPSGLSTRPAGRSDSIRTGSSSR